MKSLYYGFTIALLTAGLAQAGLITHTDYTAGSVITSAGQNSNENVIVNEFNGNINSANIAPLGVVNSNIANNTIALGKHALGAFGVPSVASKTSTYTITSADDLLLVDATGGGFTLTLPAPSTLSGKILIIKRTDSTLANRIMVNPNASETIDGYNTRTLMTKGEQWKLVTDGTNWYSLDHVASSTWTAYSASFSAGWGVVSSTSTFYKRVGDTLWVRGSFAMGTPANSIGTIGLPSGLNIDATKLAANRVHVGTILGVVGGVTQAPVSNGGLGFWHYDGANLDRVEYGDQMTTSSWQSRNVSGVYANATIMSIEFSVPIANWNE